MITVETYFRCAGECLATIHDQTELTAQLLIGVSVINGIYALYKEHVEKSASAIQDIETVTALTQVIAFTGSRSGVIGTVNGDDYDSVSGKLSIIDELARVYGHTLVKIEENASTADEQEQHFERTRSTM